jgi:predicted RNA methylase
MKQSTMQPLGKIRRSLATRGLAETARLATSLAIRRSILAPMDRRLDGRLHTNTFGRLPAQQLDFGGEGPTLNNGYEATNGFTLRMFIRALGINPANFTFIDIGCGMGRSLCIASAFPFRRVLGVELSEMLSGQAKRNIARMIDTGKARCRDLQVLNIDAARFEPPEEDCVVFLFNPFGPDLLGQIISRLGATVTHGHKLYIIYQHPKYREVIERSQHFEPFEVPRRFGWILNVTTPAKWAIYESV